MKVIYSDLHSKHDPPNEICDGVLTPYADKAERLETIVRVLEQYDNFEFTEPKKFPIRHICRVHQTQYVKYVNNRSNNLDKENVLYSSYFITDTYAPLVNKTFEAAKVAVDVSLTGAQMLLDGEEHVYSLCRPPGHHAEYKSMGGYCYFNNAAIAATYLTTHGNVAILDIDFHHGNGTQNAFYERSDVLYVSIHGDPNLVYPYGSGFEAESGDGAGFGLTINYPLALNTTDGVYSKILGQALDNIQKFKPKFLIVSAGFDTFKDDPIGGFRLTIPYYKVIGKKIAALSLPTLIIQEGGYNLSLLGNLAYSFLQGFEN